MGRSSRVGEADGELGALVGERTALDCAPVQRDEDFQWGAPCYVLLE